MARHEEGTNVGTAGVARSPSWPSAATRSSRMPRTRASRTSARPPSETAHHLADMVEAGWELAIGHGNGPQVGFILRRSEIAHKTEGMHEVPLDVCVADTQGAIGYELQQTLQNELYHRGIRKNVATIVTQVLVDRDDPAFSHPTKPIGGFVDEEEASAARPPWAGRSSRTPGAAGGASWHRRAQGDRRARLGQGAARRRGGRRHRRRRRHPGRRRRRRRVQGMAAVIDKDDAGSLLARASGPTSFSSRPAWRRSPSTSAGPTSAGSTA